MYVYYPGQYEFLYRNFKYARKITDVYIINYPYKYINV